MGVVVAMIELGKRNEEFADLQAKAAANPHIDMTEQLELALRACRAAQEGVLMEQAIAMARPGRG